MHACWIVRPRTREATSIDILYVGGLAATHRGGSGVLATELVTGLARAGHRLRALVPRPAGSDRSCARFEVRHPEVETAWFPIAIASSALLQGSRDAEYRRAEDAGVRTGLPRLIEARRPDVILVGRESIVGEIPPVARRYRVPTMALVQGGRTLQRMLDGDPGPLARRQRERMCQVDIVVAIARHLARTLAPLDLPRVAVIPNPVDLDRFTPGPKPRELLRRHAIRPRDVVIAHLSNLGPLKRPMDVIASAAQVLAVHPDGCVYLIIGDGPYREPMAARARDLGIADRVRFVGWVDHAWVPAYLRLADIVVMPSEREGLPLAGLETQASGCVLVASDIPATRELVVDGETGLVARCGDAEDLAAQTLRAVEDPELRAAIGRAARDAVRPHATATILASYVEIMGELAGRRARTPNLGARVRA